MWLAAPVFGGLEAQKSGYWPFEHGLKIRQLLQE
jgi:hypothetical protein